MPDKRLSPCCDELWEKYANTLTASGFFVMQIWDFREAYEEIMSHKPVKEEGEAGK